MTLVADTRSLQSGGPLFTRATEIARACVRVSLGWFLFHQGWVKAAQDWAGGAGSFYRSELFQRNNPDWLPVMIAAPYGHALPWVELAAGALLTLGLFHRVAAGAATLVLVSIAIAWLDAGSLLPRHMLLVFVPLSAYLFLAGPGRYSLDHLRSRKSAARPLVP